MSALELLGYVAAAGMCVLIVVVVSCVCVVVLGATRSASRARRTLPASMSRVDADELAQAVRRRRAEAGR